MQLPQGENLDAGENRESSVTTYRFIIRLIELVKLVMFKIYKLLNCSTIFGQAGWPQVITDVTTVTDIIVTIVTDVIVTTANDCIVTTVTVTTVSPSASHGTSCSSH